jgi:hypothetical protein
VVSPVAALGRRVMTAGVKEARRKLRGLAAVVAAEVFKVSKPERQETLLYYNGELNRRVEDREVQEQIDAMVSEGCPNAQD